MSGPIVPTPMDHCYDGIQEYDNPTPGWWWMLFWVTILFSVVSTAKSLVRWAFGR